MKKLFTLKYLLLLFFFVGYLSLSFGQISITTTGSALTQNFNALASSGTTNTWTDNTTIAGVYAN